MVQTADRGRGWPSSAGGRYDNINYVPPNAANPLRPIPMLSRLLFFRLLAVLGLAASAASATSLDGQTFDPSTYCGFESDCHRVTASAYSQPLGVPLPVVGLAGFATALGLTLVGREWAWKAARWLGVVGGLAGATLVVVQLAVIGRVCPLCLVADGCGIGLGLLAVVGPVLPGGTPVSPLARIVWPAAGLVAVLAPLTIALGNDEPETPAWVKAHWADDKITVVECTDFECEHCKKADAYIRERLAGRADVKLVRLPVPMPVHPNARPAALAYLAAKAQGRGEEMAAALFAATIRTPAECRRMAESLGLRMDEYDRAVASPATDEELGTIAAHARSAAPGVPLIFVQGHKIYGEPTPENFDDPLSRARPPGRNKPAG